MYVLLKMPFTPFDMEFYLFIEFLFYDRIAAHSAAAGIYGKKKILDFTLIFEKFRLF